MTDHVLIVGLDEPEYTQIIERIDVPVAAHEVLPRINVQGGRLYAEATRSPRMVPISRVVYHGIFEDDHDFIAGLALSGALLDTAKIGVLAGSGLCAILGITLLVVLLPKAERSDLGTN